MTVISDPVRLRRLVAAASLVGFPALGLVAALVDANEGTETPGAELYAIAVDHHQAILVSALFFMASSVLVIPAVGAVLHLVRGRGAGLAHVGAGFLVLGAFGHMGFATWQVLLSRVPSAPDEAAVIDLLDRQQGVVTAVLLPLLLSVPVGVVLLCLALHRAGAVPRGFMVAVGALLVFDLVLNSTTLGESKAAIVLVWAGLTALFGYVGRRVAAMSDSEWSDGGPVSVLSPA